MNGIAAVVVTYNRKELLFKCIECLEKQTAKGLSVLVVDNASTDGTEDDLKPYVSDNRIIYYNTGENLGGAGGFSFGIEQAVKSGYEYIWLMDDDTLAHPDTLEKLLAADRELSGNYGFLSSTALWTDGSPCLMNVQKKDVFSHLKGEQSPIESIGVATFVSLFLKSQVVREVGLPVKEFFIWTDDVEYTDRISSRYPCYLVRDSVVTHAMKSNIGVDLAEENSGRLERYRYCYRNEIYVYRRHGFRGFMYLLAKDGYHALRILLKSKGSKSKKLGVMLSGIKDGLGFKPEVMYLKESGNE